MTRKKRRVLFAASVLLFLSLVIPLVLYAFGYRFSFQEREWLAAGGLAVSTVPATGAEILIDGKSSHRTGLLSRKLFLQGLTPRYYHVLARKENHFSWDKTVKVFPERVTEVKAFLPPKPPARLDPTLEGTWNKIVLADDGQGILVLSDSRGRRIFFSLQEKKLVTSWNRTATSSIPIPPDAAAYLASKKGFAASYDARGERALLWSSNILKIRWFQDPSRLPFYTEVEEDVMLKNTDVASAAFYPKQEAAIVATGSKILILELDGRWKRNEFTIYEGKKPSFEIVEEYETLAILDEGTLYLLPLTW